jgi:hypothetical protein
MRIHIAAAVIGMTLCAGAFAQHTEGSHNRYKWKDADGNLHYDDALPDAALQFGYDIVNSSGLVIKHVERARTAAEIAADKANAEKVAAEKHAAEEKIQHDQQMLAAYPTEQDLSHAQQAQLDSLDQEAHATQVSLDSQEKSLTDMLGRAADLERTGKPVPGVLRSQIENQRTVVSKQKEYIATKQKERADTAQRFADELVHYRELREKQAQK